MRERRCRGLSRERGEVRAWPTGLLTPPSRPSAAGTAGRQSPAQLPLLARRARALSGLPPASSGVRRAAEGAPRRGAPAEPGGQEALPPRPEPRSVNEPHGSAAAGQVSASGCSAGKETLLPGASPLTGKPITPPEGYVPGAVSRAALVDTEEKSRLPDAL